MIARTALRALKKDDRTTADCFIWYALAERLARKGFYSGWMIHFATPRCPICHRSGSEAKFRPGVWFQEAVCATRPSEHGCIEDEIRKKIISTYNAAFDETISELTFI